MTRTSFVALILSALAIAAASLVGGCSSSSDPEDSGPDPVLEAHLALTPPAGTVIRDVLCDASGSGLRTEDYEYRWDFDGDGSWDTDWASEAAVTRRFSGADEFTVIVEVRNGDLSDQAEAQFTLDNRHGHELSATLVGGDGPQCLAWDGSHIWRSDWSLGQFYRTDPATGVDAEILDSPSQWPCGVDWDGTNLWIADHLGSMTMFEVDPATGETLSSFPLAGSSFAGGVAWDGTYLYQGRNPGVGSGSINKYLPDGTLVDELPAPRGARLPMGLAFDGENLWCVDCNVDSLYAVDPGDGSVRWAIQVESMRYGVTVDDEGTLWVHRDGEGYHLARIVP